MLVLVLRMEKAATNEEEEEEEEGTAEIGADGTAAAEIAVDERTDTEENGGRGDGTTASRKDGEGSAVAGKYSSELANAATESKGEGIVEAAAAAGTATKPTENGPAPSGGDGLTSRSECKTAGKKDDDDDSGLGIAGFLTAENIQRLGLPKDQASQW